MAARYAVYFVPRPETRLSEFGARWLGRDAWTGGTLAQPAIAGVSASRFHELTSSARHYGFHATLKAPFELAQGATEADLMDAVERLARSRRGFCLHLALAELAGFLCLIPAGPSAELQQLADGCVTKLEQFRAPLLAADLARRLRSGLTKQEADYLRRWGYPYVFDRFHFHMTLSTRLEPTELRLLREHASMHLGDMLAKAVAVDGIGLCFQESRDEPFVVKSFHELAEGDVGPSAIRAAS